MLCSFVLFRVGERFRTFVRSGTDLRYLVDSGSAGLSQAAGDLRGVTNVCLRIETDGTLRWFVRFYVGKSFRTFGAVRDGPALPFEVGLGPGVGPVF